MSESIHTIKSIKDLGKSKKDENFDILLEIYQNENDVDLRREVVSSIGRQKDSTRIYNFIIDNYKKEKFMDVVYQMYRTILYKQSDEKFESLKAVFREYFNNEVIDNMDYYYQYHKAHPKKSKLAKNRFIDEPLLLEGDNIQSMKQLPEQSIQLIFTSPPYYNAREYSSFKSYSEYLEVMKATLIECHRVIEDGRFIVINVSPVISKRPGREFESIRYPIHFDFHRILVETGFIFVDEIIWAKPGASVPNRIGGFIQTRKPLAYKPKPVTESILVYRKKSPFLVDRNIGQYEKDDIYPSDNGIDVTNLWEISPHNSKKHPAVFPELLCEKVLHYYSYKGDIVLDPWAGTGTFGVAALKLKRVPVLCEINDNYIELIRQNIKKTI